jgi:hypothetical protein
MYSDQSCVRISSSPACVLHDLPISCSLVTDPNNVLRKVQIVKLLIVKVKKGKVVPVIKSLSMIPAGVWGSGCIDPYFLDLGTSWR